MVIYDCEIKNCIPDKKEPNLPQYKYCAGWNDVENMGISCVVAYETNTESYHVYLEDNLADFQKLVDFADVLIGFNTLGFDNRLLRVNGIKMSVKKSYYDLFHEIKIAAGGNGRGCGLNAMAKANGIPGKIGSGGVAPRQWQDREYGKVIEYCLHDVWMTYRLFTRAALSGWELKTPNDKKIKLRSIEDVEQANKSKTEQTT